MNKAILFKTLTSSAFRYDTTTHKRELGKLSNEELFQEISSIKSNNDLKKILVAEVLRRVDQPEVRTKIVEDCQTFSSGWYDDPLVKTFSLLEGADIDQALFELTRRGSQDAAHVLADRANNNAELAEKLLEHAWQVNSPNEALAIAVGNLRHEFAYLNLLRWSFRSNDRCGQEHAFIGMRYMLHDQRVIQRLQAATLLETDGRSLWKAIVALGDIQTLEMTRTLIIGLRNENKPYRRDEYARALLRHNNTEALATVIESLSKSDTFLRIEFQNMWEKLGNDKQKSKLCEIILETRNTKAREIAISWLSNYHACPEITQFILKSCINDTEPSIRQEAITYLKNLADNTVADKPLLKIAREDSEVSLRIRAMKTLAGHWYRSYSGHRSSFEELAQEAIQTDDKHLQECGLLLAQKYGQSDLTREYVLAYLKQNLCESAIKACGTFVAKDLETQTVLLEVLESCQDSRHCDIIAGVLCKVEDKKALFAQLQSANAKRVVARIICEFAYEPEKVAFLLDDEIAAEYVIQRAEKEGWDLRKIVKW